MQYKGFDIIVKKNWEVNTKLPLSRFIEFEVSEKNQKSKFVFNHNFLNDMAEEGGGIETNEDKLKVEAIEEIKKNIDNKRVFYQKLYFFELYSQMFVPEVPPDWYLNRE